jgi:Histidine kinase-, DNA gyrase B-, and HSP90-like ATPase
MADLFEVGIRGGRGVCNTPRALRSSTTIVRLIGNAVKYSPHGIPVDVAVQTQEQRAVVTMRDHGVGIPAEDLARIFTRFFRASTARGVKGTGDRRHRPRDRQRCVSRNGPPRPRPPDPAR